MRFHILSLVAVVLLVALPGCGDEVTILQPGGGDGLVQGTIRPGDTGFELVLQTAGPAHDPIHGPFVIKGSDIHYDAGIGALMVDLTVTNNSSKTYPLPVRLEFVALLPGSVTVMNPSNDIHGPGAMIEFSFVDRDVHWTPGETSLPRNVQFGVGEGVSIGFAVRLHVGPMPDLGSIGGVVWTDLDEDGVHDPNEPGWGGREIVLTHADSTLDCIQLDCLRVWHTKTAYDGSYRFDELRAGHYTVILVRDRCSNPTTPTEIEVILVEMGGKVSSFLDADFGVAPLRNCCGLANGDFSGGEYAWTNGSHGPGVGSGIEEIVDIDGRTNVLHLDARAGEDYRLIRTQLTGSCGIIGHVLRWDWKVAEIEADLGLAAVVIEFIDGADAPIGRYYVRRHIGDVADLGCDRIIDEAHPSEIVGCEERTGTSFDWITSTVVFTPQFFEGLSGPEINPATIAMIRVWIESYNNTGAGVDAYFDNFAYLGVVTPGR
ncbi:MAG: hypothetical protein OEO21_05955 [Candidatus Krumholzibacteria bacterium]|nr:hypothetical protein [Candidatus Krumholzibacteria bacterium]